VEEEVAQVVEVRCFSALVTRCRSVCYAVCVRLSPAAARLSSSAWFSEDTPRRLPRLPNRFFIFQPPITRNATALFPNAHTMFFRLPLCPAVGRGRCAIVYGAVQR